MPRFAHLAKAVWSGKLDVLKQAVEEKADLNAIYDGHTALLLAIQRQDTEAALLLIKGGADVDRTSVLGTTPLMACASLNEVDAVVVAAGLLAMGANVNARDMSDNTALDEAKNNNQQELAALLTANLEI